MSLVSTACDGSMSAPNQICFDDVELSADDVFGNLGPASYPEYREQFKKETGCEQRANCTATMIVHRCVDNVEFKQPEPNTFPRKSITKTFGNNFLVVITSGGRFAAFKRQGQ